MKKDQTASPAQLAGQATQEQIDKWKADNPDGIFGITADGHVGYFREPGMQEANMAAASMVQQQNAPLDGVVMAMEACWLGGSDDVLKGARQRGAMSQFQTKLNGAKAELLDL